MDCLSVPPSLPPPLPPPINPHSRGRQEAAERNGLGGGVDVLRRGGRPIEQQATGSIPLFPPLFVSLPYPLLKRRKKRVWAKGTWPLGQSRRYEREQARRNAPLPGVYVQRNGGKRFMCAIVLPPPLQGLREKGTKQRLPDEPRTGGQGKRNGPLEEASNRPRQVGPLTSPPIS